VHELNFRELTTEQLNEESLINLAYSILVEKGQPLTFKDINNTILGLEARTAKQLEDAIVQFYTDINIDGRFIVLGENRWGLREWYAIDQVEEETAPTVKVHDHEDDLELDIEEDDTELVLEDDADEFDATDAADIDHDLDDDEEDDELAGLDVVEEEIDLDDEEDDFELEDEEEDKL
jgi:DNA-directed RNA polymerase subunit delta